MNPKTVRRENEAAVMVTLESWAALWSSHDIDALLSLFTEDCVYEDVTFGAVNRGKAELRALPRAFSPPSQTLRWSLHPILVPTVGLVWSGSYPAHIEAICRGCLPLTRVSPYVVRPSLR